MDKTRIIDVIMFLCSPQYKVNNFAFGVGNLSATISATPHYIPHYNCNVVTLDRSIYVETNGKYAGQPAPCRLPYTMMVTIPYDFNSSINTHTYVYIYIHTHTHIYIYIYMTHSFESRIDIELICFMYHIYYVLQTNVIESSLDKLTMLIVCVLLITFDSARHFRIKKHRHFFKNKRLQTKASMYIEFAIQNNHLLPAETILSVLTSSLTNKSTLHDVNIPVTGPTRG